MMPTTEAVKALFLEHLATTANVTKSAAAACIDRSVVYDLRKSDQAFATAWDEALTLGVGALEDECVRRAHEGIEEPVWYKGEQCGSVRKYSDTLLIFLLKARDPKTYRENVRLEHSGIDGAPLIPQVDLEKLSTEALLTLQSILSAAVEPHATPEPIADAPGNETPSCETPAN